MVDLKLVTEKINKMAKEKTYKRFIKCSQKTTYYQEVELTKDELDLLENVDDLDICQHTSNDNNRAAFELIEGLIDPSEIFETEQSYEDYELLKK
jgi:hypothetical protein